MIITKLKVAFSKFILLIYICSLFSFVQAQCPAGILSDGPTKIGAVGTCTPEAGMLQWNGTVFQGYDGISWNNLTSNSASLWLTNTNGIHYNTGRVGIGLDIPTTKLHVEDLNLDVNSVLSPAQKISFGAQGINYAGHTMGLSIEGQTLRSNQKGYLVGVGARTASDYSSKTGLAVGELALSKSYFGDGAFTGVRGSAVASTLSNYNGLHSKILGGEFTARGDSVDLSGSKFWIGGVKAEVKGVVNNTPVNGAIAAVIGIDNHTGAGQSWAGYFEGKGHFSNKVVIGSTSIPTTAGNYDVSNYNLIVTGGILAEEIILETSGTWADYVFEKNYNLLPLNLHSSVAGKSLIIPY